MSRATRSRTLVVGTARVPDEDVGSMRRVDDPFEALALVAASDAREPIGTVIVPAALLDGQGSRFVEAMARLDPSVDVRGGSAEPAQRVGDPPARPPRAAPAPAPAAPAPAEAPRGLRDVDLIEAVLGSDVESDVEGRATEALGPGALDDRALELMRERTGWSDLQILAADEEGAPGAAIDAETRLASSEADPASLAAWAAWLAPWIRLDRAYRANRRRSFVDELTGAWNRRYFHRFLDHTLAIARPQRRIVTVMAFDIDDFKRYNDAWGHDAGDEILRETVRLLESVIRRSDRVCRVGGDEFAVIFADLAEPREAGSAPPDGVESIARRFQRQVSEMRFPKLGIDAPGNLSISAGLATYPWDGLDADALIRLADCRALESKRRGKNHITFGPGAV